MFHEEPADQIALVAKPGRYHAVRAEQQTRILEPTERQDVGGGLDPRLLAFEGRDPECGHM
jgi:hypothetical protein